MLLDVSKKRRDQREREMKEKKLLRERLTRERERERDHGHCVSPLWGDNKGTSRKTLLFFPQRGFPFPTCIGYIVHELAARVSYAR